MERIEISKARKDLNRLIETGQSYELTRYGKVVATLTPKLLEVASEGAKIPKSLSSWQERNERQANIDELLRKIKK
jgi:antitoxin (DNA-binding transcriptional repressor) of toxin-antitoxin stability system